MASSVSFICSPLLHFIVSFNLCSLSIFHWEYIFFFFILPATFFLLPFFIISSFLSFSTFLPPTFPLNSRTTISEGGCLCRLQASCLLISLMIERQICPQWRQEKVRSGVVCCDDMFEVFCFFSLFLLVHQVRSKFIHDGQFWQTHRFVA